LEDLDGSAIRLRAPRAFTQHVSRFVYECTEEDGAAQFHGIHYLSRFGDDLADVALFELSTGDDPVSGGTVAPISLDDPALHEAMAHHGLAWFTTPQADGLHATTREQAAGSQALALPGLAVRANRSWIQAHGSGSGPPQPAA